MKKLLFKFLLIDLFLAFSALNVYALDPALYFSDITSGPPTGLGDGKGSGAIVTVWGVNLGLSQGTSTIKIGGVPASYVYYWGNSDGSANAGPAVLYNSYQRIQTISFSLPAMAASGSNTISVTVGGVTSNTLPFTVNTARICFISTSGSDLNTSCGFSAPLKTLGYATIGNRGNFINQPGDIYYVMNGVGSNGDWIVYPSSGGTNASPISFIVYPGATSTIISNSTSGSGGIDQWNVTPRGQNINFSKFTIKTTGTGIGAFRNMRAVGNEITNYPNGCADGQSGAISGSNLNTGEDSTSGIKVFGNYIHDFGCDTTTKLHHVFYISNRGGTAVAAFELGWNYLINNKVHHALHMYDEGPCGDWTGTIRMHDNVVVNQVGYGVNIYTSCASMNTYVPVEVFNNLLIEVGLETTADFGNHNDGVNIEGGTNYSNVKFYNNTIYGYGQIPNSGGQAIAVWTGGSSAYNFMGTWEYKNNILIDTHNLPYNAPAYFMPAQVHSTNLYWYAGGGSLKSPPSWDTGALNIDPQFVNPSGGFFNLKNTSPAFNAGTNTSPTVANDIRGISRSLPTRSYDIGAYQYITTVSPAAPTSLTVK